MQQLLLSLPLRRHTYWGKEAWKPLGGFFRSTFKPVATAEELSLLIFSTSGWNGAMLQGLAAHFTKTALLTDRHVVQLTQKNWVQLWDDIHYRENKFKVALVVAVNFQAYFGLIKKYSQEIKLELHQYWELQMTRPLKKVALSSRQLGRTCVEQIMLSQDSWAKY